MEDADARMVHALRSDAVPDRTLAVVETRSLGSDIVSGIEFHLQRCIDTGVAIFAITDGQYWHLYPILAGVTPGKPAAECDLFGVDEADAAAMTMLMCRTPVFNHSAEEEPDS